MNTNEYQKKVTDLQVYEYLKSEKFHQERRLRLATLVRTIFLIVLWLIVLVPLWQSGNTILVAIIGCTLYLYFFVEILSIRQQIRSNEFLISSLDQAKKDSSDERFY